MLQIKNTQVYGLTRSIIASGNPMVIGEIDSFRDINENDSKRVSKLGRVGQGTGHDNFLSGITVYFDIKYPLYWSPEFQRYHFFEIISSQSTMHRLTIMGTDPSFKDKFNKYVSPEIINIVKGYIDEYQKLVEEGCKDKELLYKSFMKIRSNLPSGFELGMTIRTNYLQLKTIYHQRKNHKLKEDWGAFCDWIIELPRMKEFLNI